MQTSGLFQYELRVPAPLLGAQPLARAFQSAALRATGSLTRLFIFPCRRAVCTCTISGFRHHYWERSQRRSRSWQRRPTVDPPWCKV